MELNYDKYIILASNNKLKSTYEEYLLYKKGFRILQQLASTTNSTFRYNGEIILKPLKQQEAQKVLDNLEAGKHDKNFKKVFYLSRD